MAYTPTGAIGLAMAALKSLVSNCTQWQTMIGGSPNAATAAKYIIYAADTPKIRAAAIVSNVATLTLSRSHKIPVGAIITVRGIAAPFAGTYTVTAVTANTLSYAKTASDDSMNILTPGAIVVPVALPFMILRPAPVSSRSRIDPGSFVSNGTLLCQIEVPVTAAYQDDSDNQEIEAQDTLSLLMQGMGDLGSSGTYLYIRDIEGTYEGPTGPEEQDDNQKTYETWLATLKVMWGLTA